MGYNSYTKITDIDMMNNMNWGSFNIIVIICDVNFEILLYIFKFYRIMMLPRELEMLQQVHICHNLVYIFCDIRRKKVQFLE